MVEEKKEADPVIKEEPEEEWDDSYSEESYSSDDSFEGHGPNKLTGAQWEEEKDRLFKQLSGVETWQKTEKEVMRKSVMDKRVQTTKKLFKKLQRAEKAKQEDPYVRERSKRVEEPYAYLPHERI